LSTVLSTNASRYAQGNAHRQRRPKAETESGSERQKERERDRKDKQTLGHGISKSREALKQSKFNSTTVA